MYLNIIMYIVWNFPRHRYKYQFVKGFQKESQNYHSVISRIDWFQFIFILAQINTTHRTHTINLFQPNS